MSQLAYVLIEAEVGKTRDIVQALRKTRGVREAHVITGPYSLIAVYEAPDANSVGKMVMDSAHTIPGVLRTITCLALTS